MKLLKRALDLVTAACLLLFASLSVPALLGFQVYAVASGSMAPQIPVGAAVYVRRERFENIRPGDVITFTLEGSLQTVTHRVVSVEEERRAFVTQGDANEEPDGRAVPYQNVRGAVLASVPYLGYLAAALSAAGGKTLPAGFLACLLLVRGALENLF